MDNEKDNELFENGEDDPHDTTDDLRENIEDTPEERVEEQTEDQPAKSQKEKAERAAVKKKIIKIALTALIVLCSVLVLLSAIGAAASNYILFPSLDEGLENALKPKLDIGTEFDISDLLKQGKAELELSDIEEFDIEKLVFSLAYTKDEAKFSATLDKEQFDAIATKKGFAASSNKINDGEYYGFSFKDLEERYEDSSFAHRGESDHALDKETHKLILEYIETFEEMIEGSPDLQKDTNNIKKAIMRAFKKSEISDCEYSYGGIKVGDEARSARCKVYTFGKDEVIEFAENLMDEFDDPSASLEKSLERLQLIQDGENQVTEMLENLLDSLDAQKEEWNVEIAIAYVDRAVSAIVGKVTHKNGAVKFTLDFGEDPQKDTEMYLTLDMEDYVFAEKGEDISKVNKSKMYGSYVAKRDGNKGEAALVLGVDMGNGKYEICMKGVFDSSDKKAKLSLNTTDDGYVVFDAAVECKLEDKDSSLVLEVEKVTVDGDELDLPFGIKLSVYRNAGSIKLPQFEDVLEMDYREFDKLYEKADEYFDRLEEEYGISGLGLNIFSDTDPAPDYEYEEEEQEEENEQLNDSGGIVYADAFPETTDLELDGYYTQKTNDRIHGWYNFIVGTTFLHDEGNGTKSGKYRIDLEKGRIYFEVQEYPEPYYLVKSFEQIDEDTIKIGYDTYEKKNK